MALKIEKFQSPGKGNGLRAVALVSPGELLYVAEPFAFTVNQTGWGKVCEFCLCETSRLLLCARCKFAKYCGKRCQVTAWPLHKRECRCLKNVECNETTPTVRFVGEIILKLLEKKPCPSEDLFSISEHVSHYNVQNEEKKMKSDWYAERLQFYLKNEIPDPTQLPADLNFAEMYAKAIHNGIMIFNETPQHVAEGLYPSMSLLNHSCEPNCTTFFEGRLLHLRALQEIQAGEELTVTYINPLMPTEERQNNLKSGYCFECDCHRCLTRDKDENMLAGDKQASDETKDLVSTVQKLKVLAKWDEVLALCKAQLTKNTGLLPDENIYQLQILCTAMDACMVLFIPPEALHYGLRTLGPYRMYFSRFNPKRALHMRAVGTLQVLQGNRSEGLVNLREALETIKLFYGQNHSLTQKLISMLQRYQ